MCSSTFQFSVDLPSHGWLPCKLTLGDESFSFSASYVLSDPAIDTVKSALYLLKTDESVDITWWLEPYYQTLSVHRLLDSESVIITLLENHDGRHTQEFPCHITCTVDEYCRTIASAFRSLIHIYGTEAYEEGARNPFPEELIDEVFGELRKRSIRNH